MNTTTTTRLASITALAIAAVLGLSACGGSDSTDQSANPQQGQGSSSEAGQSTDGSTEAKTYAFDEVRTAGSGDALPFVSDAGPVTITLSDGLRAAVPEGAQLIVDSYTVTAKQFETGMCRLDVTVDYAPGGQEAVTEPIRKPGEKNYPDAASRAEARLIDYGRDLTVVDTLPSDEQIANKTSYATPDFTQLTLVDECSEDPEDKFTALAFPYTSASAEATGRSEHTPFAEVEIALVTNVETPLVYVAGEVNDAEVSPAGEWMPKD
ncbi:hypothetical protein CGZ95_08895 [Enemella evansiae]|uniref:hypothetical protein n=1 Tax=Enemella evansiae TaxID=2016499 RepID=UPI000B978F1A|nr:hypothetical protein [Enemella evansiae]OYO00729.1 hypothetical protein CGZ95_08895 [Enemella evansiae]